MKEGALRVIDANCNRVREGARVAEDITRFILEDSVLPERWKRLRHSISEISGSAGISSAEYRDPYNDPGKDTDFAGADTRVSYETLARANSKRVQEGLRVLEEFSKLFSPEAGVKFKKLRFEAYSLETETLAGLALKYKEKT